METELAPGVRELDHTADLGLLIRADSLVDLFDRAASGMFLLVYDPDELDIAGVDERQVALDAATVPQLLVKWLTELLYLHEMEAVTYAGVEFDELSEAALRARVRVAKVGGTPIRELKGVTYHDLEVARIDDEWRARVIFDV